MDPEDHGEQDIDVAAVIAVPGRLQTLDSNALTSVWTRTGPWVKITLLTPFPRCQKNGS